MSLRSFCSHYAELRNCVNWIEEIILLPDSEQLKITTSLKEKSEDNEDFLIKNVTANYPWNNVLALDDISLEISAKKLTGIGTVYYTPTLAGGLCEDNWPWSLFCRRPYLYFTRKKLLDFHRYNICLYSYIFI